MPSKIDLPIHQAPSTRSQEGCVPLRIRTLRNAIFCAVAILTILLVLLKSRFFDFPILPTSATRQGIHLPKELPPWVMNPERFADGGPDPVPEMPVFDESHPVPPMRTSGMVVPDIMHYVWFTNSAVSRIKSALVRHNPALVYMHCNIEPKGPWWPLLKEDPRIIVTHIDLPSSIYGHEVYFGMHKTDILRMLILKHYGGIYLDTDVFVVKPLDELMYADMTMGHQAPNGLCNAIEISAPNSSFLERWIDSYRDFDHEQWYWNSVLRPYELAQKYPEEVQIIDEKYAFWPTWSDPSPYLNSEYDFFATGQFFYHAWHHSNRDQLDALTPQDVLEKDTSFNLLVRDLISDRDIKIWSEHNA